MYLLSIVLVIHVFATSWFWLYPLFLFSNGLFVILVISVVLFLSICSTSQGSWFHSFVKEATQFYRLSSSSFSLRCHPRSRDEILSQWWSVVTPRIQLSIFVTPTLAFSGDAICYFLRGWVFVCCFAFCSCYASRLMPSFALHRHRFHKTCIRSGSAGSQPDHTRTRPRHL